MSANISWEPARRKAQDIPLGAPQDFIRKVDNAGLGDINSGGGITLRDEHLPVLRGMKAEFGGVNIHNPYWHLINAIEKHGEIRVWAQY